MSSDPTVIPAPTLAERAKPYLTFVTPALAVLALGVSLLSLSRGCAPTEARPVPTDTLKQTARDAFAADPDPLKVPRAALLAACYRTQIVPLTDDPAITTTAGLLAAAHKAAEGATPLPQLKGVREAVAKTLDGKLGTNPATPLTPDVRAAAKAAFASVADVLDGLK